MQRGDIIEVTGKVEPISKYQGEPAEVVVVSTVNDIVSAVMPDGERFALYPTEYKLL